MRDQEARSLFEAGTYAMQEGRYEDALGYFERAYELSGRAPLLFNIGNMAERLRRDQQALEAYREYLRLAPAASNRTEVERRIEILEGSVESSSPTPPEPTANTPEPTAAPDILATPDEDPAASRDEPLYRKWWLWTAVGVVVVAGVATAVALSRSDSVEEPLPGRGQTFEALRWGGPRSP
jgi:tetratricopeptide (TPR) repeat protein